MWELEQARAILDDLPKYIDAKILQKRMMMPPKHLAESIREFEAKLETLSKGLET